MYNGDDEFRINTTVTDEQFYPSIAVLVDGGYIVTWSSGQSFTDYDIYGKLYNS